MKCINCEKEIPDESQFCLHCGAEQSDSASISESAQSGKRRRFLRVYLPICLAVVVLLMAALLICPHINRSPADCSAPEICLRCGKTFGEPTEHIFLPATCTQSASCQNCSAISGAPLGHNADPATCEAAATCKTCGSILGDPLGHKWTNATCEAPKTCSVCGKTNGNALGHEWVDATCTGPKTCTTCGATEGDALGHNVASWNIKTPATCTEAGTSEGTCTICAEKVEENIEKLPHKPGNWEVTVMPTATTEGTHIKKCQVCDTTVETENYKLTEKELKAEYIKACTTPSYDDLARNPKKYEDSYVKYSGRILQVCSEASSSFYYSTYRVGINGSYRNVIYVKIDNYGSNRRILEDDNITFYGKSDGLYTYETVRGDSVTIPQVIAEYVD